MRKKLRLKRVSRCMTMNVVWAQKTLEIALTLSKTWRSRSACERRLSSLEGCLFSTTLRLNLPFQQPILNQIKWFLLYRLSSFRTWTKPKSSLFDKCCYPCCWLKRRTNAWRLLRGYQAPGSWPFSKRGCGYLFTATFSARALRLKVVKRSFWKAESLLQRDCWWTKTRKSDSEARPEEDFIWRTHQVQRDNLLSLYFLFLCRHLLYILVLNSLFDVRNVCSCLFHRVQRRC